MTTSIFERVRATAADIFHLAPGQVRAETSPKDIESWDSVQHLNLVLALEQQFGIEFEPEEIEEMKSVGEISKILERRAGDAHGN